MPKVEQYARRADAEYDFKLAFPYSDTSYRYNDDISAEEVFQRAEAHFDFLSVSKYRWNTLRFGYADFFCDTARDF